MNYAVGQGQGGKIVLFRVKKNSTVLCNTYKAVQCNILQCCAIRTRRCITIYCSVMQYVQGGAVQYIAVLCNTYKTVHYNILQCYAI